MNIIHGQRRVMLSAKRPSFVLRNWRAPYHIVALDVTFYGSGFVSRLTMCI